MKTFLYVCKTDQEAETAENLCSGHGCKKGDIKRYPAGEVKGYEGENLDPLVDADDARLVVGLLRP